MKSRKRATQVCSLCKAEVEQSELRHAMAGRFRYYENYAANIGEPTMTRKFFYCPDCTTAIAKLMRDRKENVLSSNQGQGDADESSSTDR